jgi:hypothetical protein
VLAFVFLLAKLLFWNQFQLGTAPLLVGMFFFFAMQMFFIGLLGEYIGSIHTKVRNMPHVVELERVNFTGASEEREKPGEREVPFRV